MIDLRSALAHGLAAALLLTLTGAALAEPHLAVRTGLRCARCHTSPTGGGKRTPYGALYAHANLSLLDAGPRALPAGEGSGGLGWPPAAVASGEITSWLAIGADLRVASLTTFTSGADPDNSFSATQGTLYLELRPWPDHLVLYFDEAVAAGGARSREAWALLRWPGPESGAVWSVYLRGGWLLPPFGLRLLDDDNYVRRATGANFANSDLGGEIGAELGPASVALALTNGNFSASDDDELKALWGLAALDLRPLRVGLSSLYNPSEQGCRAMFGGFVAVQLWRLVLQAEVDWISQRPPDSARWSDGLAATGQLDLLLTKGLGLHAGYDFHDADLSARFDRRQRFRFGLDLFPLSMVELKLYYIHKQAETEQPGDADDRLEVVLHAYL